MPKVHIDYDELYPVYGFSVPQSDRVLAERGTVDVPQKQLDYWIVVEQEWERVQRQQATVLCEAYGHAYGRPVNGDCLTCNPPVQPLDAA